MQAVASIAVPSSFHPFVCLMTRAKILIRLRTASTNFCLLIYVRTSNDYDAREMQLSRPSRMAAAKTCSE